MIKRTIEISQQPAHLSVRLDQLRLHKHDPDPALIASIPCEDIGVVVVDHPQTTYSHQALARLCEFGAAVIVCGTDHLPVGLLLPMSTHTEIVWRLDDQLSASEPTRKQLWQQLVIAKVKAQAAVLNDDPAGIRQLNRLAREVRSGDASNIEAQAARIYWQAWSDDLQKDMPMDQPFRRDPDGTDPLNAMLNYGYAIVRAAVARALVSAGLLPAIGLHHRNRSNPFCLADDMMEPLRPMVDQCVRRLHQNHARDLSRETKAELLKLLTVPVELDGASGPLMVSLHRFTASLLRCLRNDSKQLQIPVLVNGN